MPEQCAGGARTVPSKIGTVPSGEKFGTVPLSPDSLCPRAGIGWQSGEPLETPIVQSTTFCQSGMGGALAHSYSRVSNPTTFALEQALGQLETRRRRSASPPGWQPKRPCS